MLTAICNAVKGVLTKKNSVESKSYTGANYHIGDLAMKYEAPNGSPGFISEGSKWGDPGGDSYGSYQLESKHGTLQSYLATDDEFTRALKGLKVGMPSFNAMWKILAQQNPEGFQQSQFNFLYNKPNGCKDALAYAKQLHWDVDNFALQSAIFSTSNQSGRWKRIFEDVPIPLSDTIEGQINALYDARARYFKSLPTLSSTIKTNIMRSRCGVNFDLSPYNKPNERNDCLRMLA